MTDAAPERVTLARKLGSDEWATMPKGHTMSMGYLDAARYVRADLASAAARRAEALAEAESDTLTTAQARIAELEAALEHIAGAVPSFDYVEVINGKVTDWTTPGSPYDRGKAEAYRTLNEFARRALGAKP